MRIEKPLLITFPGAFLARVIWLSRVTCCMLLPVEVSPRILSKGKL